MLDFRFIGWCHDPIENHDKVWGVISLDDNFYNGKVAIFWGRRGKKLQTKLDTYSNKLESLIWKKRDNGYNKIDSSQLEKVYPEFRSDLEKTAMWAILTT